MIHIGDDGKRYGMLIDWDVSRLACELEKEPVEPDRTVSYYLICFLNEC